MEVYASVSWILCDRYLIKVYLINSIINQCMHSQYIITQCIVNAHLILSIRIVYCLIHVNYYMQQFWDCSFINEIREYIVQRSLKS